MVGVELGGKFGWVKFGLLRLVLWDCKLAIWLDGENWILFGELKKGIYGNCLVLI